jgi:hypothetical protein
MSKSFSRRQFLNAALATGIFARLAACRPRRIRSSQRSGRRDQDARSEWATRQGFCSDRSGRIAFDADNPGRRAFHCHNPYHMVTGMMTEFRYKSIAA